MQTLRVHRALSCFILLIPGLANAEDVELYDDFEDGEILDGDPVDWEARARALWTMAFLCFHIST